MVDGDPLDELPAEPELALPDPELPFMFGHGWEDVPPDPVGADAGGDDGAAEPDGECRDGGVPDGPGVAAEEAPGVVAAAGEVVDVAGVLAVAAETAVVMPRPSPTAPPSTPSANSPFLNVACMV